MQQSYSGSWALKTQDYRADGELSSPVRALYQYYSPTPER